MTDQSIPSHEFDPQPFEEEEIESSFDDDQQIRLEALYAARAILTGSTGEPVGFAALGGASGADKTLGAPANYANDLTTLADYVLFGGVAFAQVEGYPLGEIPVLEDRHECACKIAASVTGGEADLPQQTKATYDMLERHAEKQDVSIRDAWNYHEEHGYDMSDVKEHEFNSHVPNDDIAVEKIEEF